MSFLKLPGGSPSHNTKGRVSIFDGDNFKSVRIKVQKTRLGATLTLLKFLGLLPNSSNQKTQKSMVVIKVLNSLLWPHAEKQNTNFYDIKNQFFFGFFYNKRSLKNKHKYSYFTKSNSMNKNWWLYFKKLRIKSVNFVETRYKKQLRNNFQSLNWIKLILSQKTSGARTHRY